MTVRVQVHSKGRLASATLAVALLGGCGGTAAESADLEACARPDEAGFVSMTAEDAVFDAPCVVVPGNTAFTVHFRSLDGTDHNVAIYESPNRVTTYLKGETIFFGGLIDYPVDPLAVGEYYFECTIHPEMNGPLYAVADE